jgi:diadenosine tetraphosphate (Ap4A) HIT family hydrolase
MVNQLKREAAGQACVSCGFTLFNPVRMMSASKWGVYDDARFPGRSIMMLNNHYDDFTDVPTEETAAFMEDLKSAMSSIKEVTGCERVNVAILGNAVPHVHAHLIPRFPSQEEFPNKSPWNDKRPQSQLPENRLTELIQQLQSH